MLITVGKLNLEFNEDIEEMQRQLSELTRLEEAIENSAHYKLLAGKTQMLGKGKGISKKERSRKVHTGAIAYGVVQPTIINIYNKVLEAHPDLNSQQYRQMFELNKEIAVTTGRIMAKAHDLGHVPNGHAGERAINDFMAKISDLDVIKEILEEHQRYFGEEYERNQGHIQDDTTFTLGFQPRVSFEHNELSAILFNKIIEREGVKLSADEIRRLTLGILGHSTSRTPIQLLEGDLIAQIVRVADKVEYINADYEEISTLIKLDNDIEADIISYMQMNMRERLSKTSKDLAEEAVRIGQISERHTTMRRLMRMRKLYDDIIYLYDGSYSDNVLKDLLAIVDNPTALNEYYATHKGVEALYPKNIILRLKDNREALSNPQQLTPDEMKKIYKRILGEQVRFKSIMQGENSDRIHFICQKVLGYYYKNPDKIPDKITRDTHPIDLTISKSIEYVLDSNYSPLQRALEYVSTMDDQEMMTQYKQLVEERIEKGKGFGVEPISMKEIKAYLRETYNEEATKLVMQENIGTRTLDEARALCDKKNREFFATRLTAEGEKARKRYYEIRLLEYDEDFTLRQRMIEADQVRGGGGGRRWMTTPDKPTRSSGKGLRVKVSYRTHPENHQMLGEK